MGFVHCLESVLNFYICIVNSHETTKQYITIKTITTLENNIIQKSLSIRTTTY